MPVKKPETQETVEPKGFRALSQEEAEQLGTLLEIAENTHADIKAILNRVYPAAEKRIKGIGIPTEWAKHLAETGGIRGKYALPSAVIMASMMAFSFGTAHLDEPLTEISLAGPDNLPEE